MASNCLGVVGSNAWARCSTTPMRVEAMRELPKTNTRTRDAVAKIRIQRCRVGVVGRNVKTVNAPDKRQSHVKGKIRNLTSLYQPNRKGDNSMGDSSSDRVSDRRHPADLERSTRDRPL